MADVKKTTKKKQSTAKGRFTRIWNVFKQATVRNEPVESLKESLMELEGAYKDLEEKHAYYTETLDSEDEDDAPAVNKARADMENIYGQLVEARSTVVISSDSKGKAEERTIRPSIKVKKLDAPTFSGDLTQYPSFKRDYYTHMKPVYGEDPYALKKCLSGVALKAIQGIDDDFSAMMERLDLKYGRPDKLADAIVSRIKNLKPVPEGDSSKFIELVDVVEGCWLEMKRLDLKEEMSNVTIVSEIEKLLPRVLLREWVIQKEEFQLSNRRDQFPDFLKFLTRERLAIEYMDSSTRKETKFKSHFINKEQEENNEVECNLREVIQKQKQNDDTLQKVVEGLTQVIQAVNRNSGSSRPPYTGSPQQTNNKRCWYHGSNTHEIGNCSVYTSLPVEKRIESIKINGICFACLQPGHRSRQCLNAKSCDITENGILCNRPHHPTLHKAYVEGSLYLLSINAVNESDRRNSVILMISSVPCHNQLLTTFWDPGSNTSLITRKAANKLQLQGKPVSLTITKAGNEVTTTESKEYTVPLTDEHGRVWNITAYEMSEITGRIESKDMTKVALLFPRIPPPSLTRPAGEVELLIGTDCCSLLPVKVDQVGNLQLLRNQFGFILRGSHPSFGKVNEVYTCNVVMHVAGRVSLNSSSHHIVDENVDKLFETFLEIESMGIHCEPKCGNCQCKKCPIGMNNYTIQEGRELRMIENGLKYDSIKQEWTSHLPWKKDPLLLPNNFSAALGRLKSTEKRLLKAGKDHAEAYNQQISDMVERGVARRLSKEEANTEAAGIHYIPHHEVVKPSKSTPIRIVFNSSAKFMGQSLNEYWVKGPCVLNDLYAILIRFRQHPVGIAGDLKKMYNTIKLSKDDQQTHRFLWRDLDTARKPDQYCLTTITFGDRPSAAIATIVLNKTAEISKDDFPLVYKFVSRDSYVDDLVTSVQTHEEAVTLIKDTEQVLSQGGFKVKQWVTSQSTHPCKVKELTGCGEEKILGMIWQPREDYFHFKISINFSKRGEHSSLKENEIAEKMPSNLTRRMILSQVASIYDPLGIITPVTLGAKTLMRDLCTKGEPETSGKWDTPVSDDLQQRALLLFKSFFKLEHLRFPRCIQPSRALGRPILVVFSDGSDTSFGAASYIRWNTSPHSAKAKLLTAKNRIAPRRKITIPQLELCGAVVGARLRKTIVECADFSFEKIFHLVDSSIVRAQIQKESYGFGTFVATRIGEIQSLSEPSEWWWIPTNQNPADMVTRVHQAENLDANSFWQNGPAFLKEPISDWPISKEFAQQELPDKIGVNLTARVSTDTKKVKLFDTLLERLNDFGKLISVIAMIHKIFQRKSFKSGKFLTFKNKSDTETKLVKHVQLDIPDWKKRYKRLGPQLNEEGVVVVGMRMANWLKQNWNSNLFILLPPKSRFTILYAKHVHDQDHAEVDTTIAKIRSKYWIRRCSPLINKIRRRCVTCRKRDKQLAEQVMGPIPMKRLLPSPPFYHCAVDLFGPLTIKGTVKGRTRGKGYGIMFTCLTSRACHIDIADGYDTGSFINALRRFHSIRGVPKTMISDGGTQLVATTKEFRGMVENWDWDLIYQFGEDKGTQWTTTKADDAPWENGCCEAMIKQAKRCLMLSLGDHVLNVLELQTVLYEVANLLNQRPIGTKKR